MFILFLFLVFAFHFTSCFFPILAMSKDWGRGRRGDYARGMMNEWMNGWLASKINSQTSNHACICVTKAWKRLYQFEHACIVWDEMRGRVSGCFCIFMTFVRRDEWGKGKWNEMKWNGRQQGQVGYNECVMSGTDNGFGGWVWGDWMNGWMCMYEEGRES